MKIVVVSDSHGRIEVLQEILDKHQDASAFIHCGDIELPTDYFNELLDQFSLDCSPEDLKENPEAKKCFKQLKSLKRQLKAVNSAEKRLFGV